MGIRLCRYPSRGGAPLVYTTSPNNTTESYLYIEETNRRHWVPPQPTSQSDRVQSVQTLPKPPPKPTHSDAVHQSMTVTELRSSAVEPGPLRSTAFTLDAKGKEREALCDLQSPFPSHDVSEGVSFFFISSACGTLPHTRSISTPGVSAFFYPTAWFL